MHAYKNFAEIEADLEQYYPSKTGLKAQSVDRIQKLMAFLGDPQNKPRAIHIAGTSGKTSTAYYAAALLKAAGKKVGLMTSPHLQTINERVQIDLEPLPEPVFCRDFASFMDLVDKSQIELNYSELLYGFAFWEFALRNVEFMVVEVGLGGLFDATNVITREDKICIINNVGQDHTNVLGSTLKEIAAQKAGIIQLHNAVFCWPQASEVLAEVERRAQKKQADLHLLSTDIIPEAISLPMFQRQNFTLAHAAVEFALASDQKPLTPAQIENAIKTYIPGRMEIIALHDGRFLVLDSAHNAQKMQMLAQSLQERFGNQPIAALVAFAESKGRKIEDLLNPLSPIVDKLIITSLDERSGHKSRGGSEIEQACQNVGITNAHYVADQSDAFDELLTCKESILLVTGSIYLLGQLKAQIATKAQKQHQQL